MKILPLILIAISGAALSACVAEVHPQPYPAHHVRVVEYDRVPAPPPRHYHGGPRNNYHCPPGQHKRGRC